MSFPIGVLCPILAFGIIVIVLVKILSSLVRPGLQRRSRSVPPTLVTSSADDGFWVSADQLSPETMLQYYYWVQGVRRIGQVPFQPGPDGRQFIYTGERPDNVSVTLADAALLADAAEQNNPPIISTPRPVRRRSSDTTHFPRAY
jgi:hypothetical protein